MTPSVKTHYRLSNGRWRARAGMGKTPWGLTKTQLARIEAIKSDETIKRASNLRDLADFSRQFADNARDMARSGQKDAARDWLRYFRNARVVEVLRDSKTIEPSDLGQLEKSIVALNFECHPQDVPDWSTDIAAIRSQLAQILDLLNAKPLRRRKAKFVQRYDSLLGGLK